MEESKLVPAVSWDVGDQKSVINLVPPVLHSKIVEASQKYPDLFLTDEPTLFKRLRVDGMAPNTTDNRLRLRFWDEYDRSQADGRKMCLTWVFTGVCTAGYFYQRYIENYAKLAWMMCPPASYEAKMEEALAFGIEQLRDILQMDHVLPNGRLDAKAAEIKAKIVTLLDIRVKGATVQRIEQKNLNLHVSTTDRELKSKLQINSMEEIEKRIKELEKMDKKNQRIAAAMKEVGVEVLDD